MLFNLINQYGFCLRKNYHEQLGIDSRSSCSRGLNFQLFVTSFRLVLCLKTLESIPTKIEKEIFFFPVKRESRKKCASRMTCRRKRIEETVWLVVRYLDIGLLLLTLQFDFDKRKKLLLITKNFKKYFSTEIKPSSRLRKWFRESWWIGALKANRVNMNMNGFWTATVNKS